MTLLKFESRFQIFFYFLFIMLAALEKNMPKRDMTWLNGYQAIQAAYSEKVGQFHVLLIKPHFMLGGYYFIEKRNLRYLKIMWTDRELSDRESRFAF